MVKCRQYPRGMRLAFIPNWVCCKEIRVPVLTSPVPVFQGLGGDLNLYLWTNEVMSFQSVKRSLLHRVRTDVQCECLQSRACPMHQSNMWLCDTRIILLAACYEYLFIVWWGDTGTDINTGNDNGIDDICSLVRSITWVGSSESVQRANEPKTMLSL